MQIEIGQNGEAVTLPLSQYEELLKYKELCDNSVCIPVGEYERLMSVENEYMELRHRMDNLEK